MDHKKQNGPANQTEKKTHLTHTKDETPNKPQVKYMHNN